MEEIDHLAIVAGTEPVGLIPQPHAAIREIPGGRSLIEMFGSRHVVSPIAFDAEGPLN
jgi:hypothetical protein